MGTILLTDGKDMMAGKRNTAAIAAVRNPDDPLSLHARCRTDIHPGAQPEEVIEEYRKEIRENIEYDHLRRQHPYDDIDEIADLMLEVLCTQGSFMRIGGKQLYTALVKERFLKLDSSHIEYVLDCLRESTADIRNIKAYLLEMLFNAPATCGSYYRAKVNHDFHDSG